MVACFESKCKDHLSYPTRKNSFLGVVHSLKMNKMSIIKRETIRKLKKYNRYIKKTKNFFVKIPECMQKINLGEKVYFSECRPVSKHSSFILQCKASQ